MEEQGSIEGGGHADVLRVPFEHAAVTLHTIVVTCNAQPVYWRRACSAVFLRPAELERLLLKRQARNEIGSARRPWQRWVAKGQRRRCGHRNDDRHHD